MGKLISLYMPMYVFMPECNTWIIAIHISLEKSVDLDWTCDS